VFLVCPYTINNGTSTPFCFKKKTMIHFFFLGFLWKTVITDATSKYVIGTIFLSFSLRQAIRNILIAFFFEFPQLILVSNIFDIL
jgi:hypothetical protein